MTDRWLIAVLDKKPSNQDTVGSRPIQEDIGVTYERILRSILRQDPDMILVGEIRDRETAQIAIEAALTGHVVFSTLHTNDAPSTITRLVDIGIEPFLLTDDGGIVDRDRRAGERDIEWEGR